MFYAKNLPGWERMLRIAMGMAALAFAAFNWGTSSMAVMAGTAGAMLAMSGLFGFCPACAMAGRRIGGKH